MIVESRSARAASDHRLVFIDLEFPAVVEIKDAVENTENVESDPPVEASSRKKYGALSEP
jgi:hypothetical protein